MTAALVCCVILLILVNMSLIVLIAGEREEAAEERRSLTATVIKLQHGRQATEVYVTGEADMPQPRRGSQPLG